MTPMELVLECKRVIESEHGINKVCLVIPGTPRGLTVRLDRASRRKCPMGEVVDWKDNPPRVVAYFDAIEVLAWLTVHMKVEP